MMLNGQEWAVGPGDIAVVFRGGRHSLANTGTEAMQMLVISVRADECGCIREGNP